MAQPITRRDNSSNSIFVSFVIFVVALRARGANGVDDEIVLVREDGAQIEFETTVADVTNDGRSGTAKSARKILEREVFGQKVDCDGGHDGFGQSAATHFCRAGPNRDFHW